MDALSRRLRARRAALGVTLPTAAREIGVHWTTLQRWESGVHTPGLRWYAGIARYLEVDPEEVADLLGVA